MPKLTLQDLDRELRNKQLRPVYLIYGEESYLANTALTRIKDYISVEPDRFSARTATLSEIIACAATTPMWTNFRLVIVSDADDIKDTSAIEFYFKRPSKTSTIIFRAEKADGRTKFVQLCTTAGAVIECKALYDDKVPDWVRMEAASRGKSLSMEAGRLIAELVGNSLGELSSALDKIILYIGQKKIIEVEDVETVLTETGRRSVFEFTDAVGRRNLSVALKV